MRLKRSLADSGRPEIVFTSEITSGDYITAFDRIDGLLLSAAILNLAPARGTSVKEEEHSFVECHAVRNHVAKVTSSPAGLSPCGLINCAKNG
jgi:hypothetical protein